MSKKLPTGLVSPTKKSIREWRKKYGRHTVIYEELGKVFVNPNVKDHVKDLDV